MIKANKHFLGGLGHAAVGWLAGSSLRREFSQVHLKMRPGPDAPLPNPRLDRPAFFYLNHSSWWDGYIAWLVVDKTLKLDGYLMMDVRQLRKYFFFTWVGAFSVDRFNPRSAVESINYAVETLEAAPRRALGVFPQGEIQGSSRRPLNFYNGAAQVARKLECCYLYPVALRYEFMTNQFPDVFVSIGPGHATSDDYRPDAKTLTDEMHSRLIAELDSIGACINAARFGTPEDERTSFAGFKTIMQGKGSANNRFEKIFGALLPKEGLPLLLIYQLVILGTLLVITAIAAVNLLTLRRFRDFRLTPRADWPLVSVLVPARNEQRNIERCVRSLLAQDYPSLEVIVLDDASEDGTAAIVERIIAEGDRRLQLRRGGPLPQGWLGKNNACRQLAEQTRGDYLLFTDADTCHAPFTVSSALAIAEQRPADLVTTWPRLEVESWGERVVLPLLHFTVMAYLPLMLANGPSRNPAFGLGNGQFMFFRRSAYEAIGGHGAVRDRILEDVVLARMIKARGFRLAVADGREAVSCRMYRSTAETWRGLAKTLYAFFFYSLAFATFMIVLQFLLFVAPYLFLLWAAFHPDLAGEAEWLLPALQAGLMLAVRFALAARFREPLLDSLWQPVSFLFYLGATIYAIWLRYAQGGVTWKGRHYFKPK